ncbi:putative bifunctional diguanylate cyclase/phosphodiesterase [Humisphaera borealis]|uniref:EAL domain-containing protein n=1 Tax=Humisphaera borealis TaxID=2807512 RepID=A0A7M2WTW2_9BACT|nr:EAL domain-containing protein [Humisphaera borealis]QOV88889.1 EAL domain-containing protein [Humisphaera borealis]
MAQSNVPAAKALGFGLLALACLAPVATAMAMDCQDALCMSAPVHEAAQEAGSFQSEWDIFTNFGQYMSRLHCMRKADGSPDWPWVIGLITLTAGVVVSYLKIFVFWRSAYLEVPERDRNTKLMDLAYVFLWCAVCGYGMSILMFVWPAYRLLAIFLLVLNFFSWRFASSLGDFKVSLSAKALQRKLDDETRSRNRELERLVAEKTAALVASERQAQKLALVASRTDNAVVITDTAGRIEWVNDGFTRMTGYQLDEVLGRKPGEVLQGPETDPATVERIRRCMHNAEPVEAEIRNYSKSGRCYWLSMEIQPVRDASGKLTQFVAIERDISERKQMEQELREAARTDRLTGLPNREMLLDRLQQAILRARRMPTYHYAVLFIDFDRFKIVNDSLGHQMGDRLLRETSRRLVECLRANDTLAADRDPSVAARMGGDEFVILLDGLASPQDACIVAERVLGVLSRVYRLGEHEVFSTASIGVVTSDLAADNADAVLRDADTAMYEAKARGKGRYVLFDASMRDRALDRLQLENDLRHAQALGQLRLHYQPIVSLTTGELESVEALIRWEHPKRGLVSPIHFIPITEETGMIVPIGEWVLREACRQLGEWRRELGDRAPRSISVNVARKQLMVPSFPATVRKVLSESGMAPSSLHLEITESEMMADAKAAIEVLRSLKEIGVKIDMDDFGTGYSSLSCLRQFPIDVLKIDRSFVANIDEGRDLAALVHAVTQLARNMGISVVAEGIERADQVVLLQSLECTFGQGYYFAKPMPADKFAEYAGRDRRTSNAEALACLTH